MAATAAEPMFRTSTTSGRGGNDHDHPRRHRRQLLAPGLRHRLLRFQDPYQLVPRARHPSALPGMYLGLVAIITAAGYAMKPTTPAVTDSPLARDSTSMPPGDEADAPLVPRVQQAPVRPGPGGALCRLLSYPPAPSRPAHQRRAHPSTPPAQRRHTMSLQFLGKDPNSALLRRACPCRCPL